MSFTRDQCERLVRVKIRDLDAHRHAITQREMAEVIEDQSIEMIEELPLEVTRTAGAISLTTGASRVAFLPNVAVSAIAGVILDSINKPLTPKPLEILLQLRTGTTPAKATYPWYYAVEEDEAQKLWINVWPDYLGPGDSLTTIIASSGTVLPLGSTAIPLAIAGQRALVRRCAIECYMRMGDQERQERRLGPELLDPNNPRSWVAQAEKLFDQEQTRLFLMEAPGEVTQYGRL